MTEAKERDHESDSAGQDQYLRQRQRMPGGPRTIVEVPVSGDMRA